MNGNPIADPVKIASTAYPSFSQAIVPAAFFATIFGAKAAASLVDNSQVKMMLMFLIVPLITMLGARNPKLRINSNLAVSTALIGYFLVAAIVGMSEDFKKAIEDPRSTKKLKASLIWLAIVVVYVLIMIIPPMSGMIDLYDPRNIVA